MIACVYGWRAQVVLVYELCDQCVCVCVQQHGRRLCVRCCGQSMVWPNTTVSFYWLTVHIPFPIHVITGEIHQCKKLSTQYRSSNMK